MMQFYFLVYSIAVLLEVLQIYYRLDYHKRNKLPRHKCNIQVSNNNPRELEVLEGK